MPNTLVHFGVQGLAARAIVPAADPKWVFLGCIIPDVPWILLYIVNTVGAEFDPYDQRLYAVAQASLAVSLVLCAALALISRRPKLVFGILAISSLAHLLLDAVETKWGNGVHLFAPFSWELLNFGIFWPESTPILALTIVGLTYVVWTWPDSVRRSPGIVFRPWPRSFTALLLLGAYFLLPVLLLDGPAAHDNHSVTTLRSRDERIGKSVAFDRERYIVRAEEEVVRTWAGEELVVQGKRLGQSGRVSLKGTFADPQTIVIHEIRAHTLWGRKATSMMGLALLAGMWAASMLRTPIATVRSRRSRPPPLT